MSAEPPSVPDSSLPPLPGGDARWTGMFRRLVQFHAAHGHCFVPLGFREHPELGAWVAEQAEHFRAGRLPEEHKRALEGLGFTSEEEGETSRQRRRRGARESLRWEKRFAELVAFKEKHGHLHVTKSNQLSAGMMHWRDNQRLRLQQGTMTPAEKARMDSIGFEWAAPGRFSPEMREHNKEVWMRKFRELEAFHAAHGHFEVPKQENPSLSKWIMVQRGHHKAGRLSPERCKQLEGIGFAWQSRKGHFVREWEARFAELVAFKEKHGHLGITKANQTSAGFAHWRDYQRERFRQGLMPDHQLERLDAIGFEWNPPLADRPRSIPDWDREYERLVAFHRTHGHLKENVIAAEHWSLARWLKRQRAAWLRGALEHRQTSLLASLGISPAAPPTG